MRQEAHVLVTHGLDGRGGAWAGVVLALVLAAAALVAPRGMASPGGSGSADGEVQVAMLRYGASSKTSRCFSSQFLRMVSHETDIRVARDFAVVDAGSEEVFDHPFAIMTGEGAFSLTGSEKSNLRRYLTQGGFLLASAGCSNREWNVSMRRTIEEVLPDADLLELPLEHRALQTLFAVTDLDAKKRRGPVQILGVELDGRLVLIYSPAGLNDTRNAGGGCCCCGGNEIRNAKYINANVLAYALTR